MSERINLLIELGVEELPTKAVLELSNAGAVLWEKVLQEAALPFSKVEAFATPRRLAWRVLDVAATQETQSIERKGPSMKAAKDSDGQWTKAALGFANSCQVDVGALSVVETDKGQWLMFYGEEEGKSLQSLLPDLFAEVMHALPIAKRMRWGDQEHAFVRPVLTLLVLADDEVWPLSFFGVDADRYSLGHRVHHPEPVTIDNALNYESCLEDAYVVASSDTRVAIIRKQVAQKAEDLGGHAVISEELLTEVASLVEWPVAVVGEFEARFLDVPQEVLITTMQDNQKTFAVVDDDGKIMPYFIAVANIESLDESVVKEGNERVIRPRFADAEFFWQQDLKRELADYLPWLDKVIFQEKLGSLVDKTQRMQAIAKYLSPLCEADSDKAVKAAQLSKCDLLSEMVMEFPELQGTMGRYYATHEGLPNEIAQALQEQYYPAHAGDPLPTMPAGLVLSLTEKLDTLIGGFAIGAKPTGSKDPYALRRMAIGLIRIIIEKQLDVSLRDLLNATADTFAASLKAHEQVDEVRAYVLDRLQGYYRDKGVSTDVYYAVRAVVSDNLLDFDRRVDALHEFIQADDTTSLLSSAKRIRNILRKQDDVEGAVKPDLFVDEAERQLWQQWQAVTPQITDNYRQALFALGSLAPQLEAFFADVMVNTEEADLRRNRLALLQTIQVGFEKVADLSLLPS